jgi:hypothetical protein
MIADILAQDPTGRDLLVVEVKNRPLSPDLISENFDWIEQDGPATPFTMVVDPSTIYLKARDPAGSAPVVLQLSTPEILRHYEPEFGRKRIFPSYMTALVEAWLRDLAYRWKDGTPPGSAELTEIGLRQRLEGGTTRREVPIGADPLR